MSFEATAILVAWIAIVLLALAISGLVRQLRALESAVSLRRATVGPALGSSAPPIEGVSQHGSMILLFVDADCPSCGRALSELTTVAESPGRLDVIALFRGEANGFRSPFVKTLVTQEDAFSRFRVPLTPFAVAISAEGTIADAAAVGSSAALREFVYRAQRREDK